jgi:hypothetical protein
VGDDHSAAGESGNVLALVVILIFRRQIGEQITKIKGFSAAGESADLANAQETVGNSDISAAIAESTNIGEGEPESTDLPVTFPGLMVTSYAGPETVRVIGPDYK